MSALRIGFDVSPLSVPHPPGVVRATDGLVRALETRKVLDVVRLVPAGDLRSWRHQRLPRLVNELGLAGIHSPVSAFARRPPGARVQTIHELPWKHATPENADWKHRAWSVLGPLRADAVIVPSEHVARDARGAAWFRKSKIRVVPWGIDAHFADEPPLGVVDEVVLGHYRLGQDPLALCLGAVRAKKNLAAVLRGLAELRKRNGPRVQVVVTGEDTPDLRRDLGLVSQLGLARYVSTPGRIAEEHLPSLLRLASVVPVLSRSEGFAFPVLEAMACGTPVLVPRDSAQSELAGEAGIVVDIDDPRSIADGFARALAEREALRPKLVARAREFTWDRCAASVEAIWKEIA
jgi:glycosyltransferase involved in cell wall biosynthesis